MSTMTGRVKAVRVDAVSPGVIATAEIVSAVVWLCSDRATFVTVRQSRATAGS
jgi:hypothetical protein